MKITDKEFISIEEANNLNFSLPRDGEIQIFESPLFPQRRYRGVHNHDFLQGIDENTQFCSFRMTGLPRTCGVYLWVVDDEIIYIGETINFYKRFNDGYGNISPRNCYQGGQSTNVKMNRAALDLWQKGKRIEIYVCETNEYRRIETILLSRITTEYNSRH